MILVRTAGGLKQLTKRQVHGHGVTEVAYTRTSQGEQAVYSALSAAPNPSYVSGTANSRGATTITTADSNVSVQGGITPYSYSWSSPDTGWSAISPSNSDSAFRCSGVGPGSSSSTTFTCHVTDSSGATTTATVTAQVTNTNGS